MISLPVPLARARARKLDIDEMDRLDSLDRLDNLL